MKLCKAGLAFLFAGSVSASFRSSNGGSHPSPAHAISESKYTTAHALEVDTFDPRDGWQAVNVTNLPYKYRRGRGLDVEGVPTAEGGGLSRRRKSSGLGDTIKGVVKSIFKGMKGIGKPEAATITWYTGHDLQNPSCWADGNWAPTDNSFACALTMDGWTDRPKCFKFLELCHTPKKCVFVRVVDTCAGCAPGSRHVDLTKAAFAQLASWDVGVMTVQFRPATDPKKWFEKLWGPQAGNK